MSTENNKSIYENSLKILSDLISFQTISGEDNNSLINYCDEILNLAPLLLKHLMMKKKE